MLKLHRSVTWVTRASGIEVLNVNDAAVGSPVRDFVLGVPGPGKRKIYRDLLKQLRARRWLRSARPSA